VARRGKYLLLDFGAGTLLIHLGMSGSLRLLPAGTPPQSHDHLDLVMGEILLRLRDPRRFGAVLWIAGGLDLAMHPLLAPLGIEPLAEEFTPRRLFALTRGRNTAIKPLLMDGHLVVGIGNIYASESLFRAGIDRAAPPAGSACSATRGWWRRSAQRWRPPSMPAAAACATSSSPTAVRDIFSSSISSMAAAGSLAGFAARPCAACARDSAPPSFAGIVSALSGC